MRMTTVLVAGCKISKTATIPQIMKKGSASREIFYSVHPRVREPRGKIDEKSEFQNFRGLEHKRAEPKPPARPARGNAERGEEQSQKYDVHEKKKEREFAIALII